MPNWKSKSDTELWWSSQPGNRGRTYPGDDIAEKQYQRNQAAGENNLSILRNLFSKKSAAATREKNVDLGVDDAPSFVPPVRNKQGVIQLTKDVATEGNDPYVTPKAINYDEYGLKKGGRAKSAKKKLHPNW